MTTGPEATALGSGSWKPADYLLAAAEIIVESRPQILPLIPTGRTAVNRAKRRLHADAAESLDEEVIAMYERGMSHEDYAENWSIDYALGSIHTVWDECCAATDAGERAQYALAVLAASEIAVEGSSLILCHTSGRNRIDRCKQFIRMQAREDDPELSVWDHAASWIWWVIDGQDDDQDEKSRSISMASPGRRRRKPLDEETYWRYRAGLDDSTLTDAQRFSQRFTDCSCLILQFWERAEEDGDEDKLRKLGHIVKVCNFDGSRRPQ